MICFFLLFLAQFSITSRNFYTSANDISSPESRGQELLLCRKCGADVADSNYLFSKLSPGARKTEKQNLFGKQNVTVQTLVNPFGVKFEIVTTEKARCDNVGLSQGADSWFPGYTWRICTCPHCGQHLGWTFKRSDEKGTESDDHVHSFNGLILSNILGENWLACGEKKLCILPCENDKHSHITCLHGYKRRKVTDSLIMMPKMYKM